LSEITRVTDGRTEYSSLDRVCISCGKNTQTVTHKDSKTISKTVEKTDDIKED